MIKLKPIVNCIVMLTVCALFTGCASFKKHRLPEIGDLPSPVASADKPAATYEFSSEVDMIGKRPHPEHIRSILDAEFLGVLRESGYFASIDKGTDKKELAIKVHLVNSANPAVVIPAMITGFTLYTIPSWATDTFTIVCKVTSADGKQYEYELEDASTLVQWLPMALAFPFNMPNKVPVEVRQNIYKNLIIKMQKDGLIPAASKSLDTSSLTISFEITSV